LSLTSLAIAGLSARAQSWSGHIAFRVDDRRVIAHLGTTEGKPPQVREFTEPVAKLGYGYFDRPEWWGEAPADIRVGDEWVVYLSPGRSVRANVERFVGGYVGCDQATGVMLTVEPSQLSSFAETRAKYYVATTAKDDIALASNRQRTLVGSPAAVQMLSPALSSEMRLSLESELNQLLVRELPRVRSQSAPSLLRGLEAPYRSERAWARERLQIEDAMQQGNGRLTYDVQAFRLGGNDRPVYFFVRAQWHVGNKQGFAATVWARGGGELQILDSDVRAASMMRAPLYRDGVAPSHFGLILNVLDSNRNGWGELLFSQSGYESGSITLLEYTPAGCKKRVLG
jgi:hypothetical protein